MSAFWNGFEKQAEDNIVRRQLIGTPLSAAMAAEKGKKWQAFKETSANSAKEQLKGSGKGLGLGAAVGGLAGAAAGARKGGIKGALHGATAGVALGGVGGALLGAGAGHVKGNMGEKATELHNKYRAK